MPDKIIDTPYTEVSRLLLCRRAELEQQVRELNPQVAMPYPPNNIINSTDVKRIIDQIAALEAEVTRLETGQVSPITKAEFESVAFNLLGSPSNDDLSIFIDLIWRFSKEIDPMPEQFREDFRYMWKKLPPGGKTVEFCYKVSNGNDCFIPLSFSHILNVIEKRLFP